MALAILGDERAAQGVAGALPAALFGLAEVARIVAQCGGEAGMNAALDGESGPMAADAFEITTGTLAPLNRVLTDMRNRRRSKRAKSHPRAEEAAGDVVVPALVRRHGRVGLNLSLILSLSLSLTLILGQANHRRRDGQN